MKVETAAFYIRETM